MRRLAILGLAVLLSGCAPAKPVEIRSGDTCYRCRRTIQDTKLAGELVEPNGLAYKFRTVHCMAQYIASQTTAPTGTFFVTDFTSGRMIKAEKARYVIATVNTMTNERDYLAFATERAAADAAKQHAAAAVDWEVVLKSGLQERVGD